MERIQRSLLFGFWIAALNSLAIAGTATAVTGGGPSQWFGIFLIVMAAAAGVVSLWQRPSVICGILASWVAVTCLMAARFYLMNQGLAMDPSLWDAFQNPPGAGAEGLITGMGAWFIVYGRRCP